MATARGWRRHARRAALELWWSQPSAAQSDALSLARHAVALATDASDAPLPPHAAMTISISATSVKSTRSSMATERGAAAKVLGRTGSEGVRGMFREQSWKCCLWVTVNRCKPNFRGLGVYVPRSVDWHPALWCIISLLTRTNDGNQVAPLTREHPRRRYTPVDYPCSRPCSMAKID